MSQQTAFRSMEHISFTCTQLGHLIEQHLFTDGAKMYELSVQYVDLIKGKIKAHLNIRGDLYKNIHFASEDHVRFLMEMDWIKEKHMHFMKGHVPIQPLDPLKAYQFLLRVTYWYIQTFEKEQSETEAAKELHHLVNEQSFEESDPIWQRMTTSKPTLHHYDHVERMDHTNNEETNQTNSLAISLKNHMLYIPIMEATKNLRDLQIKGCNHFIRELARKDMYTLQDLPEQLDAIHFHLIGVGPTTVKKMWDQLTQRFPNERKPSGSKKTIGEKSIRFAGESLTIPECISDNAMNINDFPNSKKVIQQIIKHGMLTYEQLPEDIEDLKQLQGIGRKRIQQFFEQMKQLISTRTDDLTLHNLTGDERIQYEYEQYLKWCLRIDESAIFAREEKVPERYMGLMRKRFEAFCSDTHVTLQQLGDMEGVTRERIRQIIDRGNKNIAHRWSTFILCMKDKMKQEGNIVIFKQIPTPTMYHYMLGQALESAEIYTHERYCMYVVTSMDQHVFDAYVESIIAHCHSTFKLVVIDLESVDAYCEKQAREQNVPLVLIKAIVHDQIDWLHDTQGVLKNVSKSTIVEHVMLRYPNGVAIYKEEEQLNKEANRLMPGRFTGQRDFTAVFSREEVTDRLLLWARGVYIHKSFVTADEQWIRNVQRKAHALVEKKEFMHVRKLYELVEEEADARNVPNEYALFSLMRLYDAYILSLERFPMIQLIGDERVENTQWVVQYFEEQQKHISKQELVSAFVDRRGWKPFTIDQILSYSSEIIPYEHGVYTLKSNYDHLAEDQFTTVMLDLQHDLAEERTISVRSLFQKNQAYLEALGVETPYILYALLQKWEITSVTLERFPDIALADPLSCNVSDRVPMEDHM